MLAARDGWRYSRRVESNRAISRFFLAIGAGLAVLAAIASLALRSWWPLAALGVVLLGVTVLSLSEAAMFQGLLNLVVRAGERGKPARRTRPDPGRRPDNGPTGKDAS